MRLSPGIPQILTFAGIITSVSGMITGNQYLFLWGGGLVIFGFLFSLSPVGGSVKRSLSLVRNPDGSFKEWRGGKDKADLKKKENTYQGISIHIGKEFKKQHDRAAKPGDIVRTKTEAGGYHQQAAWYIKTENGWRKSPTEKRKPTKAQVDRAMESSRPGR